jgi:transposase
MSREAAARIGGMDRQTLRDWVHCFNEAGVDGPVNGKAPGRPSKFRQHRRPRLRLAEQGPDFEKDGVVRWRRIDLVRIAKDQS